MRKEYDFSAARKNPYAARLKKQIAIRAAEEPIWPEALGELEAGIAEADRGDTISGEELFERLPRHE